MAGTTLAGTKSMSHRTSAQSADAEANSPSTTRSRKPTGGTRLLPKLSTFSTGAVSDGFSEARANFHERFFHASSHMGLALLVGSATIPVLALFSLVEWTTTVGPDDVIEVIAPRNVILVLMAPMMASNVLNAWIQTSNSKVSKSFGPRYARVSAIVGVGVFTVALSLLMAIVESGVDTKYYGLDIIVFFTSLICFMKLALKARTHMYMRRRHRGVAEQAASETVSQKRQETQGPSSSPATESGDGKIAVSYFLALFAYLADFCVAMVYPFFIVPQFISGGTLTRLLICLVLHPFILEAAELQTRTNDMERFLLKIRKGKLSLQDAKENMVVSSNAKIGLKQFMALYHRVMLLNIGGTDVTVAAIAINAIEEAIERGFRVELDTFVRRASGKPPLENEGLELQRIVWMCDSNQNAIVELCAIFVSTYAQVFMGKWRSLFPFGTATNIGSMSVVFLQLILELTLEFGVDTVTMWTETEHGIPVTLYLKTAWYPILTHLSYCIAALCVVSFAFIQHPFFITCGSNYPCDCLHLTYINATFGESCSISVSNGTTSAIPALSTKGTNNTSATTTTATESNAAATADVLSFIVAFVSAFAVLALVMLSVTWRRYSSKVTATEKLSTKLEQVRKHAQQMESVMLATDKVNKELQQRLSVAKDIVEKVMDGGGTILDRQKLKGGFSSLDFGAPNIVLGEGAFGTVKKATLLTRQGGVAVAVKTVRLTRISSSSVKKFQYEMIASVLIEARYASCEFLALISLSFRQMMAPLQHENVVRLMGGVWDEGADKLAIVIEFCAHGSTSDFLESDVLPWSVRRGLMIGAAKGLRYLHFGLREQALMHRDVKPANIFVDERSNAKIGDFGESKYFDEDYAAELGEEGMLEMTMVGTRLYTAPEIQNYGPYNESVASSSTRISEESR